MRRVGFLPVSLLAIACSFAIASAQTVASLPPELAVLEEGVVGGELGKLCGDLSTRDCYDAHFSTGTRDRRVYVALQDGCVRGDVEACLLLAQITGMPEDGCYDSNEARRRCEAIRPAAFARADALLAAACDGSPPNFSACRERGRYEMNNDSVHPDASRALQDLNRACAGGDTEGCWLLSRCYDAGERAGTAWYRHVDCGVVPDRIAQRRALLMACNSNTSSACCGAYASLSTTEEEAETEMELARMCDGIQGSGTPPFRQYGSYDGNQTDACYELAAFLTLPESLQIVRHSRGELAARCQRGQGQRSACARLQAPTLARKFARWGAQDRRAERAMAAEAAARARRAQEAEASRSQQTVRSRTYEGCMSACGWDSQGCGSSCGGDPACLGGCGASQEACIAGCRALPH